MTPQEEKLLKALAVMAFQYLTQRSGQNTTFLDREFITAGEWCVQCLADYGLVESEHRGGTWTDAGLAFIERSYSVGLESTEPANSVVEALPRRASPGP